MKRIYQLRYMIKDRFILGLFIICIFSMGVIFSLMSPFLFIEKSRFTEHCGYEAIERDKNVSLAYKCDINSKQIVDLWRHNISIIYFTMNPNKIYAYIPLSWDVPSFDYEGSEKDLSQIRDDIDTLSNVLLLAAETAYRINLCFSDRKIEAKLWELSLIWMSALTSGPLRQLFPTSYENFEIWSIFRHQIIRFSRIILEYEFNSLRDCKSEMKLDDIIFRNYQ